MSLSGALRRVYTALPDPPSTNYYLGRVGIDPYALVSRGGTVVDIGAGPARGNYAFATQGPRDWGLRFIGVDLVPGPGVDCVADAHVLPFASESVDGLVCVSVLEYVKNPAQVVKEFHRILKPGGVLYLSAPFVFPYHAPPEDFYRFSMSGIRELACEFQAIRVGTNRGPASTFCHVAVHFLAIAFSFNSRRLHGVLLDAFKWLLFWIKYADRWIADYQVASALHGASFFLGRKAGAAEAAQRG